MHRIAQAPFVDLPPSFRRWLSPSRASKDDHVNFLLLHAAARSFVLADAGVTPNTDGLPGLNLLKKLAGALLTFGVVLCVIGLVISAITWAIGSNSANPHLAGRGKTGVLVALGAAILIGGANFLVNFFWNAGVGLS
jgi:hypothetical protein